MDKIKVPQWLLNLTIILVIASYGFIFNSVLERIAKNERKLEDINPVLLQIQADLSSIKTNIEWLIKN